MSKEIEKFRNKIESIVSNNDLKKLDSLAVNAKDFCLLNGLFMFDTQNDLRVFLETTDENANDLMNKNFKVVHSPIALFPTVFPKKEFDYAMEIQESFNQLIYLLSFNHDFLSKAYANIIKFDEFSKRLFDIYLIVRNEGYSQVIISISCVFDHFLLLNIVK
jgi:hypothetical protein